MTFNIVFNRMLPSILTWRNKVESKIMTVFTRDSVEEILRQGGSKSWKLNKKRAQRYSYLICARNNPGNKEGVEPHGQAFLIVKIKDIVQSPDPDYRDRHMITFDEYAEIEEGNFWEGNQNPVYYGGELSFDISQLEFSVNSRKTDENNSPKSYDKLGRDTNLGLTIEEAKQGLAKTFSVDMDAIEITIRG